MVVYQLNISSESPDPLVADLCVGHEDGWHSLKVQQIIALNLVYSEIDFTAA